MLRQTTGGVAAYLCGIALMLSGDSWFVFARIQALLRPACGRAVHNTGAQKRLARNNWRQGTLAAAWPVLGQGGLTCRRPGSTPPAGCSPRCYAPSMAQSVYETEWCPCSSVGWLPFCLGTSTLTCLRARVAEQVDARDLKSLDRKVMPVRVRPRAPIKSMSF